MHWYIIVNLLSEQNTFNLNLNIRFQGKRFNDSFHPIHVYTRLTIQLYFSTVKLVLAFISIPFRNVDGIVGCCLLVPSYCYLSFICVCVREPREKCIHFVAGVKTIVFKQTITILVLVESTTYKDRSSIAISQFDSIYIVFRVARHACMFLSFFSISLLLLFLIVYYCGKLRFHLTLF